MRKLIYILVLMMGVSSCTSDRGRIHSSTITLESIEDGKIISVIDRRNVFKTGDTIVINTKKLQNREVYTIYGRFISDSVLIDNNYKPFKRIK